MRYYRPTYAEVNLGNLCYNFKQLKNLLIPGVKVMVTVKADAYGHGLIAVARRLVFCGVDYFGVASLDEGIALRDKGIKTPILVLGPIPKKDISAVFRYGLSVTVCEEGIARSLNRRAHLLSRRANIHVKVDTGMGRIGVLQEEAARLIKRIHKLKNINIEGVFTHFALADTDRDFTLHQIGLFSRLISDLKKSGINIPLIHAANSMGVIGYKTSYFNMVRPGLVIYGLYPRENLKIKLKPVLSLKTRVAFVKRVPKGYGISYCHSYVTKDRTNIVTLPIGYGDGYPRNLSNLAPVLIGGKKFKICGNICMDQIMVDVGNFPVRAGIEVVLIGRQGRNKITTEEIASLCGTIPYEIVCGLGSRVPRVYSG